MGSAHSHQPQSLADQIEVTPVRLLPAGSEGIELWRSKLPPDEFSDAQRIASAEAKDRFIQCRLILRLLLGRHLGGGWYSSPFEYGPSGKPAVPVESPVQFNIAHSCDLAVFALSHSSRGPIQIGVDVECARPRPNCMELARRFFHPDESASLAFQPTERRYTEFLRIWVRKEACLKALGIGIAGNLDSFSAIEASGRVLISAGQAVWFQELGIEIPGFVAVASTCPLPPIFIEPLQTTGNWLQRLCDRDYDAGGYTSSCSSSSHRVASCD